MPLASTVAYLRNLLDGLTMPGAPATPPMAAYITPPDPNVDTQIPTAYVWPATFDESRDPLKGGAVPRALSLGAASGTKPIAHMVHLYLVWEGLSDDPDADLLFPGIVDAVASALRVSTDPVVVIDPWTGFQSQLIDVGERMTGQITVRALTDERMNRYDCLMVLDVVEIIQG
jgi:hypothetical protein